MENKIVFSSGNKIGVLKSSIVSYLSSGYLNNYKKNRQAIHDKHAWKTSGVGASFRGDINHSNNNAEESVNLANINGLAYINDGDKIVYSVSVDEFSGLFIKDIEDESESHIIHDNKVGFYNIDFDIRGKRLAASIHNSTLQRNLAVVDMKSGHYNTLTEGDSLDENPSWSKAKADYLYFDTAGIGRDLQDNVVGFSQRTISGLNLETYEIDELVEMDKYDCFLPKDDSEENLYFIRKPYDAPKHRKTSAKDIILIPFKLVKAIFNWMEFFTMRYTGETFKTGGKNPAKGKNDPKQIFIQGNLINAEENYKENQLKGEKFPGIAPRSWELMKICKNGSITSVKKGVIDYDVSRDGELVYSNGVYIIKLLKDGSEVKLGKSDAATKLRII